MNRLACPVETASDLAFDAVVILHCAQRARRNGNKVPRRFRVGKLENPQLVVTHAPGAQRISIKWGPRVVATVFVGQAVAIEGALAYLDQGFAGRIFRDKRSI